MMNKVFYRFDLSEEPEGLIVVERKLISVHETEKRHYCVTEDDYQFFKNLSSVDECKTFLQLAKHSKIKYRIIHKDFSNIAKDTKELAFEHLKSRQKSVIKFAEERVKKGNEFLKKVEGLEYSQIGSSNFGFSVIPDTKDFVDEFYIFD